MPQAGALEEDVPDTAAPNISFRLAEDGHRWDSQKAGPRGGTG
jgi:hypothetical protein